MPVSTTPTAEGAGRSGWASLRSAAVAVALAGLALGPGAVRAEETFGIALTGPPGPYGERLTLDDRGLTLRWPDDAASLRIGGRLQLDPGVAGTDQPGLIAPLRDTFSVRRSWLESYLTIGKTLEIAFQYDFANPSRPIQDAAIAWRGLTDTVITVGNMKEPFGLEWLESNNSILFTERSLLFALSPLRNFGLTVGRAGPDWSVLAGVFGGNANIGVEATGVAAAARATYAPIRTEARTLHLGLAGSYRSLQRASLAPAFSVPPDPLLFPRPLISTGDILDASSVARFGAELMYLDGPFALQAEYARTDVERFDRGGTAGFQGGYVQAGYVINGRRSYSLTPDYATSYGVLSGVDFDDGQRVSQGGYGAFEFGLRLSTLNLNDRFVRGGTERDVTLGINWYPDNNVRVMANYTRTHASASLAQNRGPVDADLFVGRVQLYW